MRYQVRHNQTGRLLEFEWNGLAPPTDADMDAILNNSPSAAAYNPPDLVNSQQGTASPSSLFPALGDLSFTMPQPPPYQPLTDERIINALGSAPPMAPDFIDRGVDAARSFLDAPPLLSGREMIANSALGGIPGIQDWLDTSRLGGVTEAGADVLAGFTTPMNTALAVAPMVAPIAASPWVGRAFATEMLSQSIPQLPQTLQQIPQIWQGETPEARRDAAYNVTAQGLQLGLGGMLAKHGFVDPYLDIRRAADPTSQLIDLLNRGDVQSPSTTEFYQPPAIEQFDSTYTRPFSTTTAATRETSLGQAQPEPVGIPTESETIPLIGDLKSTIEQAGTAAPIVAEASKQSHIITEQLPSEDPITEAAILIGDQVFKGPSHPLALQEADAAFGGPIDTSTAQLGFVTRSGKVLTYEEGLNWPREKPATPIPAEAYKGNSTERTFDILDQHIAASPSEPIPSPLGGEGQGEGLPAPSPIDYTHSDFDNLALAGFGTEDALAGMGLPPLTTSVATGTQYVNRTPSGVQGNINRVLADVRAQAAEALNLTPEQTALLGKDTRAARALKLELAPQLDALLGNLSQQHAPVEPLTAPHELHIGDDVDALLPNGDPVSGMIIGANERGFAILRDGWGRETILPEKLTQETPYADTQQSTMEATGPEAPGPAREVPSGAPGELQEFTGTGQTQETRLPPEDVTFDYGENAPPTPQESVIPSSSRDLSASSPQAEGEISRATGAPDYPANEVQTFVPSEEPLPVGATSFDPSSPTFGQTNTLFTRDRLNAALQRVTERASRASAGVDPGYLRDAVEIGGYYLEAGLRSFAGWSKVMVERLGERIRPHLGEMWNHLSSRDDLRTVTGELAPVGKFAGDIVGVQQRVQSLHEELSAVGKAAFDQAPTIEETGTIQPVPARETFRSAELAPKPETYSYQFSQEKIDTTRAHLVELRNQIVGLTARLNESADPLAAGASAIARDRLTLLQRQFESAAHEFRRQRFAAGRAVGAYRQFQLPKEFVEGLGDVGKMLDGITTAQERLPIWTNLRQNLLRLDELAPAEKKRLGRDLVDAWRLNLFSVGSWTLDLVGNASELGAQTVAGTAGDLVHVARGNVSFPHLQGMFRAIKDRATSFREPLDPRIEEAFGRTVSGEVMGPQSGSAWPSGDRGTFTMRENKLGKTIDTVLGAPLYAKGSFDLAAKRLAGTTAAFREAILAADRHELKGTERTKFIDEYVQNLPDNALHAAITEGNKAGFNRQLTNWEEAIGRSTTARLVVDVFARWPFQFARWGGEMLGYNRELWGQVRRGTATPEQIGTYLAKTATGYGALYLLSQLDNPENRKKGKGGYVDYRSMEYVRDDGSRVRLSGREPLATGLWLVATLRGDVESSTAALRHVSLPFARAIIGEGGLLGGTMKNLTRATQGGKYWTAAVGRELEDTLNRLLPGQAVLGAIKSVLDPTLREGVGANLPGVSYFTPPKISITTGQSIQPRQSILGVDVPAVSGVPIPGASLRRDPVYQLLSQYDLLIYRGPRTPLGGTPPADLTRSQRRDWEQLFGETRSRLIHENVLNHLPELQAQYSYEQIRKLIQQVDAAAAAQTRAHLNQQYRLGGVSTSGQPLPAAAGALAY